MSLFTYWPPHYCQLKRVNTMGHGFELAFDPTPDMLN